MLKRKLAAVLVSAAVMAPAQMAIKPTPAVAHPSRNVECREGRFTQYPDHVTGNVKMSNYSYRGHHIKTLVTLRTRYGKWLGGQYITRWVPARTYIRPRYYIERQAYGKPWYTNAEHCHVIS